MTHSPRPSRIARAVLQLARLGDARADVVADLDELFQQRLSVRGVKYARRRYFIDVISILLRPFARTAVVPAPATMTPATWFGALGADAKYALRVYRRQAGVTTLALSGLALAIAVVTSAFAIVNAFNFKPAAVAEPDALIRVIRTVGARRAEIPVWPYGEFLQLRESTQSVVLDAVTDVSLLFSESSEQTDDGARVTVAFVSADLVATFGGRAEVGRILSTADDDAGAPPVALLQHRFWRSRFGSDPGIAGRTVFLSGKPVTIAGVLEARFSGPFDAGRIPALLLPIGIADQLTSQVGTFRAGSKASVRLVGRLRPSTSVAQAQAEISSVAMSLGWIRPVTSAREATDVTVKAGLNELSGEDQALIAIVMTIVALVLVLAATNVANLLLAGATARQEEIGARLALGATRGRLIRQLLTESFLLGTGAGIAGFALAFGLVPLLRHFLRIPEGVDLSPDLRVYVFVAAVSLVAGLAAGIAPARHGTRGDVVAALKRGRPGTGAPTATRLRSTFIGVQATASILLLVLTALFGRALIKASRVDVGLDVDRLLTVSAGGETGTAKLSPNEFWPAALDRVRGLPGIEAAAFVEDPPFSGAFHPTATKHDGEHYRIIQNRVGADYFATTGLRITRGRGFSDEEVRTRANVAVISERVARDFWPDGEALGSAMDRVDQYFRGVRVVGVVRDPVPVFSNPRYFSASAVYRPFEDLRFAHLVVRTTASPAASLRVVQDAIGSIEPGWRPHVSLVRDGLQRELEGPRLLAAVTALLGILALTLAVIGLFGITAFSVAQRRREIGIRLAVGATERQIIGLVFKQGMRPVLVGTAIGLAIALVCTRVIAVALSAGVSARDPASFMLAVAVLLMTAAAGVLVPSRRATVIDPVNVLKDQ